MTVVLQGSYLLRWRLVRFGDYGMVWHSVVWNYLLILSYSWRISMCLAGDE